MMRNRHKTLQRLLAVKSQLQRLEEAQLAEIQRRKQALIEERHAMFDLLGDAETTDSLVLGLACRHVVRTDRGQRELDAAEKAQAQALRIRSAQKKALEKILLETQQTMNRDAERKSLLEIGEGLAACSRTSLP